MCIWRRTPTGAWLFLVFRWVNRHRLLSIDPLELHDPVHRREQRIVAADLDVPARVEARAALAHQDAAGAHRLAAEALDPEPLRVAFAPVPGRADPFLVCHRCFLSTRLGSPSNHHFVDADLGEPLTVPLLLPVVLAALALEDDDLLVPAVPQDLCRHARPAH